MPNDQEIMINSVIEPFEYKPRLYYERMCQKGAVGNDELFFRIWRGAGGACNFSMPAMLTVHSNPIFIGKSKISKSAEFLHRIIEHATGECTQADKQFLYDLVELSLNYSSITGSSTPVKTAKALGKAYAGMTRLTKMAAKQITAPLNLWEQKQLMYAMYCAIEIYLINSRVFTLSYSKSAEGGFAAYKKAISAGNKNLITYGAGKVAADIYKIANAELFRD